MNRFVSTLIFTTLCLASVPAFAGDSAKDRFEEAFYLEQGERKFAEAAERYAAILKQHAKDEAIVSKATLRLGLCQEQLGKCAEAKATLEGVAKRYPAHAAAAKEALSRIETKLKSKQAPKSTDAERAKAEKAEKDPLDQRLQSHVSLNFEGTPLHEVADFLRDISRLNVVVDGTTVDTTITLRVRDVTLEKAIGLIASLNKLEFAKLHGAIVITTKERLALYRAVEFPSEKTITKADDATYKLLVGRQMTLNFPDVEFGEAIQFLRDITTLNFVITRDALEHVDREGRFVTLRLREVSVENALKFITSTCGLSYRLQDGIVVIERKPVAKLEKTLAEKKKKRVN